MKWYLHHFPTTTSFLSSGALMTGEASPGYLPYPDVAKRVRLRLPGGQVKIVTIGRNPIERAYSSYRYNYFNPMLTQLKDGKVANIEKGHETEYYEQFLFTFEEMMQAELNWLRKCLSVEKDGSAVKGAREDYSTIQPWKDEFERRIEQGLDPMVDLDTHCYGKEVNNVVLRKQWEELMHQNPTKVIGSANLHLKQSFIGRSLYVLPLEWWYVVFQKSDLYFVCTEELQDMSGQPMDALGQFLGLSAYNFSSVVQKGAYNVGGHKGYDNETPWSEVESTLKSTSDIPLTEEFRREVEEFIRPYNERLFRLTGKRCNW